MKTTRTMGPARLAFNSGYWDGRADQEAKRRDRRTIKRGDLFSLPHDASYGMGYAEGFDGARDGSGDPLSSEPAWLATRKPKGA